MVVVVVGGVVVERVCGLGWVWGVGCGVGWLGGWWWWRGEVVGVGGG